MASILRSSKFVRYIAGFAKNVVVNTPRDYDGSLVNTANAQCICGALPRSFASQTSAHHDQTLDLRLKTLDQDVRKSGRISRRDIEDILDEIRNTRTATSSQSLLVIRCCGSLVPEELPEVRTKLVEEIWNTLNKLNVPMDVSHYNALLRVYLENEHKFSPTEFLSTMEGKGIEPNRVTYQRLIARYCQDGDIEGATKILEHMREKQMPVNENVFNALIVGHSQAGDMDSAQGILSVMAQAGLEASADTYTTLLCGYAKGGNIEKIIEIMNDCESKEIYLLDKDYLDIIYSLASNGHAQHVPAILTKVHKSVGYNQDAVNMILRLINKNQLEAAFEILKSMPRSTRPDGSLMPVGAFFIRQLVKAGQPLEKILEYCKKLEEEGLYERGLSLATEVSVELGNEQLAYQLFDELKKNGHEIRQHYFWPLIIAQSKEPKGKGIIRVLQKMSDFNLTPNSETIRDYVLPNLKGNSVEILALLREANVSVGTSASSLVISLLQKNNINEAAAIAGSVNAYYPPELIKKPLTKAFYESDNIDAYINIIRSVYDNLDRRGVANPKDSDSVDQTEIIGSLVLDLTTNPKKFPNVIFPVLSKLVQQGLSISTTSAQKLENKIGEKMTDDISGCLGKLTSGELTPIPVERRSPSYVPSDQMNIPQLETLIRNLEAKNQDTKGLKRRLFTLYYREKDLNKVESLVEDFKKSDFVLNSGIHAQLMDVYAYHGVLDKALEYYEILKKDENNLALDETKLIRLAHLLTTNGRLEDAIKLLEEAAPEQIREGSYSYSTNLWRFLNSLAEEGRVEDLNRVFDILVKKNLIEISNSLLGPLIKVHLVREELDKALEKFEWCVNQYRATPWKNELSCRLIQKEDAQNLQKVTDLSTVVHGEVNSLYDLVFSFVECGRIRQARKILETPGMQNRPQRITFACERYQSEGLVKPLEDLRVVTKDLNHIDRGDIYYQLLLSYIKQDDPDKCVGLWTQMQEEDLAPSDDFLLKLAEFLQSKQLEVPFVLPQSKINVNRQKDLTSPRGLFRRYLRDGDLTNCLKFLSNRNTQVSITEQSELIEKLVQNDRLSEATKLAFGIFDRGHVPVNKILKFLLNKLAKAGNIEAILRLGERIDQNTKKNVSYDNKLCQAYLEAGQCETYLNILERDIGGAKDENLKDLSERFPRGGACGILEKHPQFTDKYEQIAIKYAQRDIIGPLNVLWSHYFINHDDDKAENIWKNYLTSSPRIMFQRVVQTARENKDEKLIQKLITHLKESKVTEGALGNAISCLLDVLISKDKDEEVVDAFESALKDVKIDSINRTAVLRVKGVYEKLGKQFNYPIPAKKSTAVSKEAEESF